MDDTLDVATDHFHERETDRLRTQLQSGCHLRIYHFGESPAYAFLPAKPDTASQVRHQLAQSLLDDGSLMLVEKGWNFNIYELAPSEPEKQD